MLTVYAATAGVFFTLTALCAGAYLWHGREAPALVFGGISLALAITAVAGAVKPALLPWLTPVTFVACWASWRLKDRQAPKP